MVQHAHRGHAVEGGIGKRKGLGVALAEVAAEAEVLEALAAERDGRVGEVHAEHLGALARKAAQDVAVAAPDVQHLLALEVPVLVQPVRELDALVRLAKPVVELEVLPAAPRMRDCARGEGIGLPVGAHIVQPN